MDFLRQLILTFLHVSENPVNVFKLKLTFYFYSVETPFLQFLLQ